MKYFYSILLCITAALCLTSCDKDEKVGCPPIFQGFSYTPSVITPGTEVTITAVQRVKGTYIYGARHNWKLSIQVLEGGVNQALDLQYSTPSGTYESSTDDPKWVVTIPSNAVPGRYTCTFSANWNNAADGETDTYSAGTGSGCYGTITSTNSLLYSKAQGSFSLTVR